jgi:hypothetical protein
MFIRFLSFVYGIANLELNCIDVAIFVVLSKDATPFSIPKLSKTFTHYFSFSSYRSLRYTQRKTPKSPRVYDTYIELVSSWWYQKKNIKQERFFTKKKASYFYKAIYFYMMFQTLSFFALRIPFFNGLGYPFCLSQVHTEVTTSADGQVLPTGGAACSFWRQHRCDGK